MKNNKLMFSYGMNTNRGQMALRCPDARSLGRAVLYGHEFRFARHADIIENPAFNTRGVLWDITEECEKSLDALEGFPDYYLKKTVNVEMLFEGYAEHDVNTEQIIDSLDTINILNHNYQQIQEKYYPEEA